MKLVAHDRRQTFAGWGLGGLTLLLLVVFGEAGHAADASAGKEADAAQLPSTLDFVRRVTGSPASQESPAPRSAGGASVGTP